MKKKGKLLVILGTLPFIAAGVGIVGDLIGIFDIFQTSTPEPVVSPMPPAPEPQRTIPIHLSAYTDFSLPIALYDGQRLYLTWQVLEGGPVTVGLVTPEEEFFGFCENSNRLEKDYRIALEQGNIIFSPAEYGWGTGDKGDYNVQMTNDSSQTAEIEVRFWREY